MNCSKCQQPLPPSLFVVIFGPPQGGWTVRYDICLPCWEAVLCPALIQGGAAGTFVKVEDNYAGN